MLICSSGDCGGRIAFAKPLRCTKKHYGKEIIMFAIMRFAKRKGGQITSLESHNERRKNQYKSNPDIDLTRILNNYHIVQPEKAIMLKL